MHVAKRGTRQVRTTQTLSLPPELRDIVVEKAEQSHGGNVSRYIRKLVEADIGDDDRSIAETSDRETTERVVAA